MAFSFNDDHSIVITQGDSGAFQIELFDDEDETIPTDLTGMTVKMAATKRHGGQASFTLISGAGITVQDNVITIVILPAYTKNMKDEYFYDIEISNGSNYVETFISSTLTVEPQVA